MKIYNPTLHQVVLTAFDGDSVIVNPKFRGVVDDKFAWQFPDQVLTMLEPPAPAPAPAPAPSSASSASQSAATGEPKKKS